MITKPNISFFALGFLVCTFELSPGTSSAITVEVAKACNALVAKQFPPRVVGNPAAGSTKGNAQGERDYFNKCIANGGKMEEPADKSTK